MLQEQIIGGLDILQELWHHRLSQVGRRDTRQAVERLGCQLSNVEVPVTHLLLREVVDERQLVVVVLCDVDAQLKVGVGAASDRVVIRL